MSGRILSFLLACALHLALAPPQAQTDDPGSDPAWSDPSFYQDDPIYLPPDEPYNYGHGHRPQHAAELAFSPETIWAAYRGSFYRGKGYGTVGILGNEDDDFALVTRLMRFGEPETDVPLGIGVGFGFYGFFLDQPDEDFFALSLAAYADYAFDTPWPMRLTGELSFAPDIATSAEADGLIDVLARIEVELSSFSGAYLGYRFVEVGLDAGGNVDLDNNVHFGIRLWL